MSQNLAWDPGSMSVLAQHCTWPFFQDVRDEFNDFSEYDLAGYDDIMQYAMDVSQHELLEPFHRQFCPTGIVRVLDDLERRVAAVADSSRRYTDRVTDDFYEAARRIGRLYVGRVLPPHPKDPEMLAGTYEQGSLVLPDDVKDALRQMRRENMDIILDLGELVVGYESMRNE